ncbi:MAG: SDR family oxidoreductase [Solirubrobacteraceae bacterium]|nr:SDR family oxidoreductase [Solirubrobacteraceae bacterium]
MSGSSQVFADGVLAGQVALVTGGGTGLGRATAAELLSCGAQVVIAGRRADVIEATAEQLGEGVTAVQGDVRTDEGAAALIAAVLERHGRLDVLVNNAGGQYFVPAEAIEQKGWRAVWRLNLGGTRRMCEAAIPAFKAAGGGTIVNVTFSPHHGLPGMTHSGAARAGVEGYTRALAARLYPDGIAVMAAAAGHFHTDALDKYPEGVRASAAAAAPMQRLGRPEEHAWLVALCASPMRMALSGAVLTVDGARDNYYGAWPPVAITVGEGEVPTETRKPPTTR